MADAPTPFWLVWSPQGERPPRCRHGSFVEASREADHLARLHPGKRFYVLEPAASVVASALTREIYSSSDDMVPF